MNTSQKGDSDSAPLLTEGAVKQDILPFPDPPSGEHRGPHDAGLRLQPASRQRSTCPTMRRTSSSCSSTTPDPAQPSLSAARSRPRRWIASPRSGIAYNRFHTTGMCSPTRASLLTGRNHHRVGNGQIAEMANDWDGYSGRIPESSALVAEVLKDYGYATSAFGKWHNTPANETTAAGPFDYWPTGSALSTSTDFSQAKLRSTSRT